MYLCLFITLFENPRIQIYDASQTWWNEVKVWKMPELVNWCLSVKNISDCEWWAKEELRKITGCLVFLYTTECHYSKVLHYLEVRNVPEHKWIIDCNLSSNLIIHSIHIGLIHSHALLCQRRCIIDWNVMQFWMLTPILIWKRHSHYITKRVKLPWKV